MKKLTTNEFVEKSRKIHGNKYDYSKVDYINNRIEINLICPIHGIFQQVPYHHLGGRGCADCGGSKKWNIEKFIEEAKKVHGDKYCYNEATYINGITPLKIICKIHGEFFQSPGNHLSGKECGKCIGNVRLNTDEFIEKANKIHNNKYDYSVSVYGQNNNEKIKIICPTHGMFLQDPSHHLSGRGCAKCSSTISNKERKFLDFIKIPDTKENRQKIIFRFKVDGIDLTTNTIYEFMGDYFHGNPKKFNSNDYNKVCHKTFGELYENTLKKLNKLKESGYFVKYIWESDWDAWNEDISKNIPIIEY